MRYEDIDIGKKVLIGETDPTIYTVIALTMDKQKAYVRQDAGDRPFLQPLESLSLWQAVPDKYVVISTRADEGFGLLVRYTGDSLNDYSKTAMTFPSEAAARDAAVSNGLTVFQIVKLELKGVK